MSDPIVVANQALTKLGANQVLSLNDEIVEARVMKALYEPTRDAMLASYQWNFALTRAKLAQLTEVPVMEFPFQFALPDDYLRLIEVWYDDQKLPTNVVGERKWIMEGRRILAKSTNLMIRYVRKTDDYSPLFEDALSNRLAFEASFSLTDSTTNQNTFNQIYQQKLAEARTVDSMENQMAVTHSDQLSSVRY